MESVPDSTIINWGINLKNYCYDCRFFSFGIDVFFFNVSKKIISSGIMYGVANGNDPRALG